MKVSKKAPWFEIVAFLLILLMATASYLAQPERTVASNSEPDRISR